MAIHDNLLTGRGADEKASPTVRTENGRKKVHTLKDASKGASDMRKAIFKA